MYAVINAENQTQQLWNKPINRWFELFGSVSKVWKDMCAAMVVAAQKRPFCNLNVINQKIFFKYSIDKPAWYDQLE